jgi:hypothetical protein
MFERAYLAFLDASADPAHHQEADRVWSRMLDVRRPVRTPYAVLVARDEAPGAGTAWAHVPRG